MVKVSLIIRQQDVIPAGGICEQIVYNALNLPPPILDIARLTGPTDLHERSLTPLWQLQEEPLDWWQAAVSTYNGQQFGPLYTENDSQPRLEIYLELDRC